MNGKAEIRYEVDEIVDRYRSYVEELRRLRPNYRENERAIQRANMVESIFRLTIRCNRVFAYRFNRIKYVFHTVRYKEIIELLPKDEVLIIGGREDYMFCVRNKMRFVPHLPIYNAISRASVKGVDARTIAIASEYRQILKLFEKTTIFLYEDCLQVGAALSVLTRRMNNIKCVCIQHGVYSKVPLNEKNPGFYSRYNFVYSYEQGGKITKNTADTYVLGLPYDARCLPGAVEKIFLVGHGTWGSNNKEYLESLVVLAEAQNQMRGSKYSIVYRPRPGGEVKEIYEGMFEKIERGDARSILRGGRAIFIGFASTLLYEALCAGHIVIVIEADGFVAKAEFEPDLRLPACEIYKLRNLLDDGPAISRLAECKSEVRHVSLSTRFVDAMNWVWSR